MIEEGFIGNRISQAVIENYLEDEHLKDIESLVLGCTHYPLIKGQIADYYNQKVEVIDPSEIVAQHLKKVLQRKKLCSSTASTEDRFYVSDYTESFERSTQFFFGESITLEKASIWS
jgi:glutamate racemase